MTPGFRRVIMVFAALCALCLILASVFVLPVFRGGALREASLLVPTGADFGTVCDSLGGKGKYLRNVHAFRLASRMVGLDSKTVKPGRYLLHEGTSPLALVRMIKRGAQTPVKLKFNNIRTIELLAASLARQTEPDSAAWMAAFADPAFTAAYGLSPATIMTLFIPDTYEVYWNTTPGALCGRMQRECERFWGDEKRAAALIKSGFTPVQAYTLASIVYEETKRPDEMARVAGVYANRLRIRMPLQADPTVKFAVGDPSIRRILNKHLAVDSPYNTYKFAGLPPGPISMPSKAALDAVVNYERHNYLYFCASPDFSGHHLFARTLAEHAQNARAWAAALNRQGIRR